MLRSDDEKKGEPGLLDPERIVAEPGFNRWLSVPPVLFIQGSIGSIYAWSVFNNPLTRVSPPFLRARQLFWCPRLSLAWRGLLAHFGSERWPSAARGQAS